MRTRNLIADTTPSIIGLKDLDIIAFLSDGEHFDQKYFDQYLNIVQGTDKFTILSRD